MTTIAIVLGVVFVVGAAIGIYAWRAPRASVRAAQGPAAPAPLQSSTDWTKEAGAEFAELSESARCDLIFAVADLHDERSQQLLVHALEDPADAVAIAAAHALAQRGSRSTVAAFAQRHPGARAEHIMHTLALLQQ